LKARLAAFALLLIGLVPQIKAPAEASTLGSFQGNASAEGMRFTISSPGFLVVEDFVDGGTPVAQAGVNSLGDSKGFASAPYPGDLALTGGNTLKAVTGFPVALPPYPFVAQSSYPTPPESKVAFPGVELSAVSRPAASQAMASTGAASGENRIGGMSATADVAVDDAKSVVLSAASSHVFGLSIAGVLEVGRIDASASVRRSPGENPQRASDLRVEGLKVGGVEAVLTKDGVAAGGSPAALPDGKPLTDALRQQGLSVEYLAARDQEDGVVSPGVVITREQQVPNGPPTITRWTFGRAAARAAVSTVADGVVETDLPAVPFTPEPADDQNLTEPAGAGGGRPGVSTVPADTATDGTGRMVPSADAGAFLASASNAAPPATQAPGAPEFGQSSTVAAVPLGHVTTTSIYAVLVLGGLLGLLATAALSKLGMRYG
jgi:hypothetical protein